MYIRHTSPSRLTFPATSGLFVVAWHDGDSIPLPYDLATKVLRQVTRYGGLNVRMVSVH